MDCQRQFDGHLATLDGWHVARSSAQQVGHERADIDVVGIVVGTILAAVDRVGHTGPLRRVACSLQGSWQSADLSEAFDVAHAASKAYGIGRHHAVMVAQVADGDAVEGIIALVEVERAEVYPRRTAHLLVDVELGTLALMPNGIQGVVNTGG